MRSNCKGKCHTMTKIETRKGVRGSFRLGFKRCSECEYFFKVEGNRCPCCNSMMKTKPRNNTARRKLEEWRLQNG
jgi:lipopolysaccharide biosynthesis regulator YciM